MAGAIMFHNVDYRFNGPAGKLVHVPSEKGKYVGSQVRELLADYRWDRFYRHLGRGGHIDILHRHRPNAWFATADVENFFPSVRRNMVAAALRRAGVRESQHFAKWSTVRAPEGGYVLPFGFPASPLLATLVIQESPLGSFLRAAAQAVTVQVYLDDISLSSGEEELLGDVHEGLLLAMAASGFAPSARKTFPPARRVELFNCVLEQGMAAVSAERRAAYDVTGISAERFKTYCRAVERGNWR